MQRVYEENEWGKVSKRIVTRGICGVVIWIWIRNRCCKRSCCCGVKESNIREEESHI